MTPHEALWLTLFMIFMLGLGLTLAIIKKWIMEFIESKRERRH